MASQAKLTVRVTSTRGGANVSFTSVGNYISTPMNGYSVNLVGEAVQPTSDQRAFWLSILAIVQEQITTSPPP